MLPRLVLTCAFAVLLPSAHAFAQAQPPAESPAQTPPQFDAPAYVAVVDGGATLERDGRVEASPLNMPLLTGDRLRTTDGRLEVRFADGGRMQLDTGTSIDVLSDDLVRLAETKIRQSGRRKKLNVEWFGGEPLLNREFLEAASTALQELCAREGVVYRANIVSNGTCWPDDVGSFVERHKINVAQITIDGSPEQHNRRRRVRSGREDSIGGASSFDAAWATIGKLLDHIRVDVRVNVDAKNAEEVFTVIALARASGWMSKPNKVFIYPAKLFKASEHVDFIRRGELSEDEFAHLNERVRRELTPEYSVPEFYDKPLPKHYVCGALAYDSAGVGADGRLYRCSLQLTEPHRSVGTLAAAEVRRLPVVGQSSDSAWWDSYDPTQNKKCSVCSFLPLCMGGCAKTQLEQDAIAIEQNTQYWRSTLPKTVARYIGATCRDDYVLGEREQFRTGRPA